MKRTILVAGTWGWRNDDKMDWYWPGSPFVEFLLSNRVWPLFAPAMRHTMNDPKADLQPFIWSTSLGGIGFGKSDLTGWAAAGVSLYQYIVPPRCPEQQVAPEDVCVIAHSHGLQVVLFAAAFGLKIDTLISVAGPVRSDMMDVAKKARPNITQWTHIHSDKSDKMQWLGEMFDGHLGVKREHPLADKNESVKGVGHSQILHEVDKFHLWTDNGWLERLKQS